MQFIMFTNHLLGLSLTELIKSLVYVGVSGADLAVRKNYPINPDNMEKALPSAAKSFRDAGLEIPIVTAPTSLTQPTSDSAETFYAACGAASIPHIKLGYSSSETNLAIVSSIPSAFNDLSDSSSSNDHSSNNVMIGGQSGYITSHSLD